MAHEITKRADGFHEMAFVGETPWHGLGQELEENASIETWKVAAGMDWTIESTPVRFTANGNDQTFAGRNVLHRSDTGMPLSVVSDRYKPVQPNEVLEFFKDLVEESGFRLHTAGTLFGGKRLWALAETGKFGEIVKDDGIGGFLLLSTSSDKSLATTARFTTVRVVCNNTLSMATKEGDHCVSFSHSRHFDHELMKAKLGKAVESFDAFMQMGKYLQTQQMRSLAADNFVRDLLAPAAKRKGADFELGETRAYQTIWSLFEGGAKGSNLVGHTKWGMLNAVTEYLDHHMPARTADARLNNTWFGNGDKMKLKAIDLLMA